MYHLPDHYYNLSLRLSEALDNIGVNQWAVSRMRRNALLQEKMETMAQTLRFEDVTCYIFGSMTEVSTTPGLKPDIDFFYCLECVEVIQEMRDWRKDYLKVQYLMVQNELTSSGYCLLKPLRGDIPAFCTGLQWQFKNHFMDHAGNVYFTHSDFYSPITNHEIHGPAMSLRATKDFAAVDKVFAYKCQSWPREAKPWLELHNKESWPDNGTKRSAARQGCFLVPVSSTTSAQPGLEWRISTSLAERCLMFCLNITQLRCYILLKMIIKIYLKPQVGDVISSFMCKCILFYCIAQSQFQDWQEHTLVTCLVKCLRVLLQNIRNESCPHFVIPGNNLLGGKVTASIKLQLEIILSHLIKYVEPTLLGITVDDIGLRLYRASSYFAKGVELIRLHQKQLVGQSKLTIALSVGSFKFVLFRVLSENILPVATPKQCLKRIMQRFLNGGAMDQMAYRILSPFLCSVIGTMLASDDIQNFRALSPKVKDWFNLGLCSDMASSKLKLASVLFCAREFSWCKHVLKVLCRLFSRKPVFICCLCELKLSETVHSRYYQVYDKDELQFLRDNMAFCVQFVRSERYCVPKELQYEMFQSTHDLVQEDTIILAKFKVAVVDPLPYLYFLQYKLYRQLRKLTEQLSALTNLIQTIDNETELWHKEVALNLLGNCMELENRNDLALKCYVRSLILRQKNNVATWHIILMLFSIYRRK